MQTDWARPIHWQDFEELCYQLYSAEHRPRQALKYGRAGQAQYGVDIAFKLRDQTNWTCLQCKVKDDFSAAQLTEKEIVEEYNKSKKFPHPIENFIIATTTNRDRPAQDVAMRLTDRFTSPYPIEIKFWDYFESLLTKHTRVAKLFYPERFANENSISVNDLGSIEVAMNPKDWKDRFALLVRSEDFQKITYPYSDPIEQILSELIQNCLDPEKGGAGIVRINVSNQLIQIEDDGKKFYIFDDSFKPTEAMHGLAHIKGCLEEYRAISYKYIPADLSRTRFNKTELSLSAAATRSTEPQCWTSTSSDLILDRAASIEFVQGLSISSGCDEYVLTVYKGMFLNASSSDQLIIELQKRLNGTPLRIRVGRDCGTVFALLNRCAERFANVIFEEI